MTFNESDVFSAALEWFGDLGYALRHVPQLAPCQLGAECKSLMPKLLTGEMSLMDVRAKKSFP
jgi:hypothetical protein